MNRLSIALFLCIAFLSACSSETETNVEKGNREQILYIGNGSEPLTIDPSLSTGIPSRNIQMGLFEGLVSKNTKTLQIEPAVATQWEISEDGLRYQFKLRENARWSNGDSVTAHDFVNTYSRILSPKIASQYAYMLYYIKNAEAYFKQEIADFSKVGVKAISDFELVLELENPTPYFLQLLDHHTYYPVHKPTIEKTGDFFDPLNPWTRPETFVGNGAFTLDVWDVNRAIEIKRNEHYWDQGRIHLNRIVYFPIEDKSAEDRAFRAGQIHLTYTSLFSPEKIAVYKEKNPDVLRSVPSYSSYHYLFNTRKAPFDNIKVRKALALSIDRNAIVKSVTKGGEIPAYNLVPPDPEGYSPKKLFEFNPEEAKKLLSEAGYPNGEGFPSFELLYNNDEVHRKVATTIQQMWKTNLNISTTLTNQEWKVYLNSRKSGDFDVARAGWIGDFLDPSNFLEIFLSYSGNNHTGWKNPNFDDAVRKSQKTLIQEDRALEFDKATRLLIDEMPIIPIFYYTDTNLVATEVKGWHNNVLSHQNYKDVKLVP